MKYKTLKDQDLINALITKTQTERNLTLDIIELLEEVDQRKLFLERGYGSLIEFCIKELKYSESAAYRRISAMRVVRDVPEVKVSISNGTLNLVQIAQAQTFLNQEKKYNNKLYSKEEKKDLVLNLENKSKRECEKILIAKSPDLPKPEKVKHISPEKTQVTLSLNSELIHKLDQLKLMYSHINPNATYAELIEIMTDKLLKNKSHDQSEIMGTALPKANKFRKIQKSTNSQKNLSEGSAATPPGGVKTSRYIPAIIKKQVLTRDQACCSYQDPKTKRRCGSKFQLQFDHKYPFALGGENTLENLRLVCRNHNQFFAERVLELNDMY